MMNPCPVLALALVLLTVAAVSAAPVQITRGPGNDTEAAWSPDGRSLVYQHASGNDRGLMIVNVATGAARPLATGPGEALYPAWSPDGRQIAYSFAHFTQTVAQGLDRGYNLMLIPAAGGTPRRLTDGLVRDYVPAFSPDGKTLYYSSTREMKHSAVGVWRLALPAAGASDLPAPERVFGRDADDCAAVQPAVSPDGRLLAFGLIRGMRSNWTITLAKTAQPDSLYPLSDPSWACYGPRWSPDGRWLACTGYRPGDAGWGIYLVEVKTGGWMRLDTGPGNSRSPAWSPDGKQLAFENNRTGSYKLYRLTPQLPAHLANPQAVEETAPPVLKYSFAGPVGETVKDLTGSGNDGKVVGKVTAAEEGGVTFADGSYITAPQTRGCDFGRKSFSVKAEIMVEQHTHTLRMIVAGDYPNCQRGWQFYLSDDDRLWFSSRTAAQLFIGARSDEPLPVGQKLTVIGSRDRTGLVELYINGMAQASVCNGADMSYPVPTQVRVGLQFDGTMPATGLKLYGLEIHPMLLMRGAGMAASLEEFLRP